MSNIQLDLHGVKHEDVSNTVKRFVEDNWEICQICNIITGKSQQMQILVGNELHKYGLNWLMYEGYIEVHLF